jgi:hypothetical protein
MRADPVRSRNAHQKTQTDGRNAQRAVRSHSHIELSEPKRELLRGVEPLIIWDRSLAQVADAVIEARLRTREIAAMRKKAARLGLTLVEG